MMKELCENKETIPTTSRSPSCIDDHLLGLVGFHETVESGPDFTLTYSSFANLDRHDHIEIIHTRHD
jgi:hypothetical protein